jgi:hypothetical protein
MKLETDLSVQWKTYNYLQERISNAIQELILEDSQTFNELPRDAIIRISLEFFAK